MNNHLKELKETRLIEGEKAFVFIRDSDEILGGLINLLVLERFCSECNSTNIQNLYFPISENRVIYSCSNCGKNVRVFQKSQYLPLLLMYVNASVNKHYHRISDGEIIVHAHPFASSDAGSHKHSKKEIKFLAAIGNPDHLIVLILLGLVLALLILEIEISLKEKRHLEYSFTDLNRNKAPPYRFIY